MSTIKMAEIVASEAAPVDTNRFPQGETNFVGHVPKIVEESGERTTLQAEPFLTVHMLCTEKRIIFQIIFLGLGSRRLMFLIYK